MCTAWPHRICFQQLCDCTSTCLYTNADTIPLHYCGNVGHNSVSIYKFYRSVQWETTSLILCLHWADCANACRTNRGWQPFCFSVTQNLPRFDARIWPHFGLNLASHTSALSSTHKLACRPHFLICDCCY